MDERPPQVTSPTRWARIERNRRLLVWAGAGLVLVAIAVVAIALLTRTPKPGPFATYEPIPGSDVATASRSSDDTGSAIATSAALVGDTPSAQVGGSSATTTCLIAYRRDGSIRVAKPDGSAEVALVTSSEGVFSLSPDARTLAYVDATTRVLALVDVATLKAVSVGPATLDRPVWPLGSGWCVYTGAGKQTGVRQVSRDGSGAKGLFAGESPAVSPDGSVIVGIKTASDGSTSIVTYRAGKVATLPVVGYALDLAISSGRVFYAVAADDLAEARISSVDLSGGGQIVLRSGTQAGARASFQEICVSPDGSRLVYAEAGDDGYSRLFAMSASDGSAVVPLSVRRDDYPLCWGCDGLLYFIEGNSWQGEATKLLAVGSDGIGRRVVIEGAGR